MKKNTPAIELFQYHKFDTFRSDTWTFGYIGEREVDEYNGKIKVFVQIGTYDRLPRVSIFDYRAGTSYSPYTISLESSEEWRHLSELNLEKVPRSVLESIKSSIDNAIKSGEETNKSLRELLEQL